MPKYVVLNMAARWAAPAIVDSLPDAKTKVQDALDSGYDTDDIEVYELGPALKIEAQVELKPVSTVKVGK